MLETNDSPTVKLRKPRWLAECNARGFLTDGQRAAALGVNRSQVIRVQNGESAPGPRFMAAACRAFGARLDDLFEVAA